MQIIPNLNKRAFELTLSFKKENYPNIPIVNTLVEKGYKEKFMAAYFYYYQVTYTNCPPIKGWIHVTH